MVIFGVVNLLTKAVAIRLCENRLMALKPL